MKINIKNLLLILSFICFQFSHSQIIRNVGDFNSLRVQGKINVILIKSSYDKIEVDEKNASNIDIINKNGELKLHLTTKKLLLSENVTARIFYQNLQSLQAKRGAIIQSEKPISIYNLKLSSSGNSLIDLNIKTENLMAKASSGGKIILRGNANNQNVTVSYSGKYNGKDMKSSVANIKANSNGIADIFVTEVLKARVRTGASVIVHGNPNNKKDRKTSLGGNILFLR